MKERIMIGIIVVVLLVLFLPVPNPKGRYEDGGTREYCALPYKIVVWNKMIADVDTGGVYTYHETSVFWIPDNFKNIDELWKIERGRN